MISRKEAINTLKRFPVCTNAVSAIEALPDAVTRCRECKNRSRELYNIFGEMRYFCPKVEKYVTDDKYCYMAERAKDEI